MNSVFLTLVAKIIEIVGLTNKRSNLDLTALLPSDDKKSDFFFHFTFVKT